MAEFLIKAVDETHSDPVEDQRGCYKRGDIVVVMPDGHEWGKEEGLPKFVVVKIPDLAVSKARKYTDPVINGVTGLMTRRRLRRVLVDDVPSSIKQQLRSTGEVTVTMTQIKNYIQNKVTLEVGA